MSSGTSLMQVLEVAIMPRGMDTAVVGQLLSPQSRSSTMHWLRLLRSCRYETCSPAKHDVFAKYPADPAPQL